MEEPTSRVRQFLNHASTLVEKRTDLILLTVAEKVSGVVATLALGVILGLIGLFILLFGGITLGWWLSSVTGSAAIGFLLVTALYIVFFALFLFFGKRPIQQAIIHLLIKKIIS